jgi:hypothetical protein
LLKGDIQVTAISGELITIGGWTALRKKKLSQTDELYVYDCTFWARNNPVMGEEEGEFEWSGTINHYYDEGMELLIAKIMLTAWGIHHPEMLAENEAALETTPPS